MISLGRLLEQMSTVKYMICWGYYIAHNSEYFVDVSDCHTLKGMS